MIKVPKNRRSAEHIPLELEQKKSSANSIEEDYEESARIVTEMLNNIKKFLMKTKNLTDFLNKTDLKLEDSCSHEYLSQFEEFQRTMMKLAVLSDRPLNHQLTGAFVFRVVKDITYWKFFFPFVSELTSEVETAFQNQKASQKYNIELIYFIVIKRISAKAKTLIANWRDKKNQNRQNRTFEQTRMNSHLEKYRMIQAEKERLLKQKDKMIQNMHRTISTLYYGLQVDVLQPVNQYYCDLTKQQNMKMLLKDQLKRNKRVKKDIVRHKSEHGRFIQRKRKFKSHQLHKRKQSTKSIFKSLPASDQPKYEVNIKKAKASFKTLPKKNSFSEPDRSIQGQNRLKVRPPQDNIRKLSKLKEKQNKGSLSSMKPIAEKSNLSFKTRNQQLKLRL